MTYFQGEICKYLNRQIHTKLLRNNDPIIRAATRVVNIIYGWTFHITLMAAPVDPMYLYCIRNGFSLNLRINNGNGIFLWNIVKEFWIWRTNVRFNIVANMTEHEKILESWCNCETKLFQLINSILNLITGFLHLINTMTILKKISENSCMIWLHPSPQFTQLSFQSITS